MFTVHKKRLKNIIGSGTEITTHLVLVVLLLLTGTTS